MDYIPSDIEKEAIRLIDEERTTWETTVAYVTDRVAFNMKNLIRQCRKNWWGVFDQPVDPQTGRAKVWVPLTESVGETVVKNIDLDTKDINFTAKKPAAVKFTSLVRSIVRNYLDEIDFGEKLDELENIVARDGTCVWKIFETKKDGKLKTDIRIVDLLNVYLDPTSPSIQEAYRFTERALLYPDEIRDMTGWLNLDVEGVLSLPRNDGFYQNRGNFLSTVKSRDVWESYGKYPKYLKTGNKDDKKIDLDLHIVVSGLEAGKPVVHLIKEYDGLKPYEEAWYAKVPGRWFGKGVSEKLMMLQIWINTIVNIRINRAYVSQLGLFTIRRGSGITPQMISRLAANGAVVVNSADDIKQLAMEEASASSYKDEANAQDWAQRVTSAYEVVTGEQLPSETSATATAIQSRSAQSQFALVKEQIGMFLQRFLKRHCIPTILKNLTHGDLVRMALEPEELVAWDSALVDAGLYEELDARAKMNVFVNPEEVMTERDRVLAKFKTYGIDRFTTLLKNPDFALYKVAVDITNESIDKGVVAQNLIQALTAAPEYREQLLPMLFDLMGIPFTPIKPQAPMLPNGQPAGQGAQPTPASPQTQQPAQVFGRANTLTNQSQYGA